MIWRDWIVIGDLGITIVIVIVITITNCLVSITALGVTA